MKIRRHLDRPEAFTLVEMIAVITIIGLLAALLLPTVTASQKRAKRAWCESNLRQIGIAFHAFGNDHNGRFPMAVSTNDGGSMEWVRTGLDGGGLFYSAFRQFQPLARDLSVPRLLICPTDLRAGALNFSQLQNANVSFAAGVNADFSRPGSVLAADRNLAGNPPACGTILQINAGSRLHWTAELHEFKGNVLFADGHAEQWNQPALAAAANRTDGDATLFLPSVPAAENNAGRAAGPLAAPDSGVSGALPDEGQGNPAAVVPPGNARGGNAATNPAAVPHARPKATTSPAALPHPVGGAGNNFNETAAPGFNPHSLPRINPQKSTLSGASTVTEAESPDDEMLSPFDRELGNLLRRLIIGTYLGSWLVVLLYFAYKFRQRLQEGRRRRELVRLRRLAEATLLNSDDSFR